MGSIKRHLISFSYSTSVPVPSARKGVTSEVFLCELSSFYLDLWLSTMWEMFWSEFPQAG